MMISEARSVRHAITCAGRSALAGTACAVFSILLVSAARTEHVPAFISMGLFGLAALTFWRPGSALTLLACLIPVATWTGRTWNPSVAWPETLVVAFLAGYSARAVRCRREPSDNLDPPIFVFTALVIASLAARIAVLFQTVGGAALKPQLWQVITADYFVGHGGFAEIDAAMRLIEGALLLRAAASLSQADPLFAPRLVRWCVIGASAAAVLNLWRIWQGALRLESPVVTFLRYLATVRINIHYGDVNAAGSYFIMALFPAIALAVVSKRPRWAAAAVLVTTSLLLSGSRAALVAGAVAALVWMVQWIRLTSRDRSWRLGLTALLVLLVAGAISAVFYASMRRNVTPSSTAVEVRTEFARTSFRMLMTRPAFGVGIGQYYERSGRFASPRLLELFPASSENAHNNFLQILAELGIVGFVGFLWVLGTAGLRSVRLLGLHGVDPLRNGLVLGLLAFALTWLAGHPLLIDEPAFVFWMLLGAAAGWGHDSAPLRSCGHRRASAAVVVAVLAAVALSVPARARQDVADADLEHRGIGVSAWHHGDDGVRYRLAGARSTVFVPAYAQLITLPLRSVQPETVPVALYLNGRPADVVHVPSERWYTLRLALPSQGDGARFHRLELRVAGASASETALLMVGKVEPR